MDIKDLLKRSDRCVYCLEFPNGMKYVGKTGNLGDRMRIYLRNLEQGDGGKVCDAIREFGLENVDLKVLASVSGLEKDDLELALGILEIKYIREMDCIFPKGYNVSFGGEVLRIPPEYITTDAEAIKAFKVGSKSVLVYDLEGNFLREYDSLMRMDYELGLGERDYAPFLDKKKPVCDKYYIRSKKYNVIPEKIEVTPWVVKERVKYHTTVEERVVVKEKEVARPRVLAYDVNGDFVGEFKNRAEACRVLNGAYKMPYGQYVKGYILYKKVSDDYPKKIESYVEVQNKILEETYKPKEELQDMPPIPYVPTIRKPRKKSRVNLNYAINQLKFNGELVATYDSIRDAAQITGIPYAQIYNCVRGATRMCQGYLWERADECIADSDKSDNFVVD